MARLVSSLAPRPFLQFGLLLAAQLLALAVFVVLSHAESGRPPGTRDVPGCLRGAPRKLTIVFVDSLAEHIAKDSRVMPELAALAQRGVALDVTPCRDQLTYLCLRALLTGYDESSLLAVRGNFTHAPSAGDNLLDRLSQAGQKVVVVGSHDFEAYQSSLYRAKLRDGSTASEALLLEDWAAIDPERRANVAIVSLSSGDRAAHVFGTRRPEYSEAFHAIDGVIGDVARRVLPGSDLLVFGDHGHDERGRHLPGLDATTYAVYVGPSFRENVRLRASLTDHRAILGLLLGVPTPPAYGGPAFEQIFRPGVPSAEQVARFAEVRALPSLQSSPASRILLALTTLALAIWIARSLLSFTGLSAEWSWAVAVLGAVSMALAGNGYDAVRLAIHDHGSEPIRSLWLLLPLGIGCAFGLACARPGEGLARRLERGALATVLVSFALLFPNAYYYGATRATLLAAIVAVFVVFVLRVRLLSAPRGMALGLLSLSVMGALSTLYGLHDVGGRTREMAYFVLSSPLFGRHAGPTLLVAKLVLWLSFARAAQRSRRDLSLSALLLVLSVALERSALPGARIVLFPAALGYLALRVVPGHRFSATRVFLGLVAIGALYRVDAQHIAPMQVLFVCVVLAPTLFRALFWAEPERAAVASGVTLALTGYLLLWPTLGMRFSGIDFQFMFDWVPAARSEELWWLIGLGVLVKFALPYAVLQDLGRGSTSGQALRWAVVTLALKLTALSVFAAWYSTSHTLLTNGALEILAELGLLILASALGWPAKACVLRWVAGYFGEAAATELASPRAFSGRSG